jgi:D-alanyl-D-alanine carboxypeptidase
MRDSTFGDPAGLTDETSYKGGPKTSAYDLAIATRNALTVPAIAHWAGTTDYEFTDPSGLHHTLHNHDKFLPNNGFGYVGANGFKTGYTELAQHSLVATAKRGGRECIAVILGAVDGGYTWAASLLDQCWVKPRVATTGKFLPPIAVSPYASRTAARAGFARVALGRKAAQHEVSAAPKTTTPSTAGGGHASTPSAPAGNAAAAGHNTDNTSNTVGTAAAANAAREINTTPAVVTTLGSGGGGLLTSTRFILVVIVFLAVAFALRRRAVRNQRARRIARQRARAKAMRSGSLPVVDGKYRTGTRVGPPDDSGVRVARSHIDIPAEERRRHSRSRNS